MNSLISKNIRAFCVGFALILASCDDNETVECVFQPALNTSVEITLEPLHDQLLDMTNRDSLQQFLKEHPIISTYFLRKGSYPNDSVMMDVLLRKFSNPHIDSLQMEIQQTFGNLDELTLQLNQAFSHLKYYYPSVKIPRVKTIATGFDYDLYVSDSLIIIGLDYYLGDGARYRPINMYQYILKRYQPEYIVPSIMLLYGISSEFNKTTLTDKTILADMISYGKSFYFAKHMMPCTPDSVIIWYTPEEIAGSRNNIDIIWTHFVENELLYETNHMVKKKYIEDRPKTYEIGDAAPGRIGTWLGWQIINKYMADRPDMPLHEMMETSSAQKLFKESKFKPDKGGIF